MYLDETYRYWRILIADASNPDTYIQLANIGLFAYDNLIRINADRGSSETKGLTSQRKASLAGVQSDHYHAQQRQWVLRFNDTLTDTDVATLTTVQEALLDSTHKKINPLWVHWFSDDDDYLRLVHWNNIEQFSRQLTTYLLNTRIQLSFDEAVKV
jgi:hypothetical protein